MANLPITIDCQYLHPSYAASYLVKEGSRTLFIENNTAHSVPILLETLKQNGLSPDNVEYLIVTHVHLDHAGGSYALMKACKNAILLAHPKAAVHLIDPSRLISSARKVYGDQIFDQLYGEIGPIDPNRVRSVSDFEELNFGSRTFKFLFTRGHANHHICIYDTGSNGIFTGDSFGLAYPALQSQGLFIFPTTSPTDFDSSEAKKSIQKILDTNANRAYLTHFGELTDLRNAALQLNEHLDFSEWLLQECIQRSDTDLTLFCKNEITLYLEKYLKERQIKFDQSQWNLLNLDIDLNASGIAYQANKMRIKTS